MYEGSNTLSGGGIGTEADDADLCAPSGWRARQLAATIVDSLHVPRKIEPESGVFDIAIGIREVVCVAIIVTPVAARRHRTAVPGWRKSGMLKRPYPDIS
jgi:hypothetical protein